MQSVVKRKIKKAVGYKNNRPAVPKIHQQTGAFSWQHGNLQPSSPRFYNFAYKSYLNVIEKLSEKLKKNQSYAADFENEKCLCFWKE
uniref:Uncharacterized protein n=1 Tax=Vespula pensylvanica TaxID=30213 RepID=A0A834JYL9_VESPE|nr:hypothetical protein H0235_016435 [Vespula pensylvanica]